MKSFITGSRVYGTPRPDSDVDLVVLLDKATVELLSSIYPIHGGSGRGVSLRIMTTPDFPELNVICMDAFDMLAQMRNKKGFERDIPNSGLYIDAPWVEKGLKYKHSFTDHDHRRLAKELGEFKNLRIVVRYGDHPLIRELYSEKDWAWRAMNGRNQANDDSNEVLIVRKR